MPALLEVEAACQAALQQAGVPAAHAKLQVSLLLDAELRGHTSHGLLRLPRVIERIANGVSDPAAVGEHLWRGSLLEVEGRNGLGPVVAVAALDAVSERARDQGVSSAVIRNCNHLGMLAWYAERIVERGQILIGLTISEALVHPWGGRRAMLGTNPVVVGVPATPVPFVLDMATSVVSMGKIHDHAGKGRKLPEGWALDADGQPTTDASAAKGGAIAPFGGAKGYALGVAFEVLVASLTGCATGREVTGTLDSQTICNKGDVFIVMQPAPAGTSLVSGFLEALRQVPAADPEAPVRVPGDRARARHAHQRRGSLEVDPDLWAQIRTFAEPPAAAL